MEPGRSSSRALTLAGVAAIAAGVWMGIRHADGPTEPSAFQSLVAAVGATRPVEGRLTGGFSYAPWPGAKRGEGRDRSAWTALAAAARVREEAVARSERTEGDVELAVATLIAGDLDESVRLLEDGRHSRDDNARLLNDLAVVYLARGTKDGRADDIARALDAAERATRIDRGLVEAWFNRALALEAARLTQAARGAWDDYFAVDASSAWADEGRRRHATLAVDPAAPDLPTLRQALTEAYASGETGAVRKAIRGRADLARELVIDVLLVEWAGAQTGSGEARCHECLPLARSVAQELSTAPGDRLSLDLVTAAETKDPDRVAAGILAFNKAKSQLDGTAFAEGMRRLPAAHAGLATFPAGWAVVGLYEAVAAYHRADYPTSRSVLAGVTRLAVVHEYPHLAGRAAYLRGLMNVREAKFSQAIDDFNDALHLLEAAEEWPYVAAAVSLVGEAQREVGDRDAAWRSQFRANEMLSRLSSPRRRHNVLIAGGLAALQENLPGVGIHLQTLALTNAAVWKSPGGSAAVQLQLAQSHAMLGELETANTWLETAKRTLSAEPDPVARAEWSSQLHLAEGAVWQDSDPAAAIRTLTEAREGLLRSNSAFRLAKLHLTRARAHIARGDTGRAETDLRDGIAIFQSQRAGVRSELARISHFNEVWGLYGELIDLLATSQGRTEEALDVVEQSRARALVDMLTDDNASGPSGSESVANPARPSEPVVVYAALPERLLIWVLTTNGTRFVARDVTRVTLDRLVRGFVTDLDKTAGAQERGERLFDLLLAPVFDEVPGATSLVVVPDGPLHALPFAALPFRQGLLLDGPVVSYAPSLTQLAIAQGRIRAAAERPLTRALVVGDPGRSTGLPALPMAAQEARAVARRYANSTLLLSDDATKTNVLRLIPDADVVHMAGHAIANPAFPAQAHLVLATNDQSQRYGRLDAREISALRLESTRLVVLSACSSAAGPVALGEGVLGLGRAFLAAGVPVVVASLWPVDDRPTRVLLEHFHTALAEHDSDPARALRAAQRTLRNQSDPLLASPSAWSAFVVMGGTGALVNKTARGAETP